MSNPCPHSWQLLNALRGFSANLVTKTKELEGKMGDLQCNTAETRVSVDPRGKGCSLVCDPSV